MSPARNPEPPGPPSPATGTMDLRRLMVFREVARSGSFAAAAQALFYTPSAVSQQMAALEREAGVPLFERSPRGVRLARAGDVLLARAEAILDQLADAQAELRDLAEGAAGELRFGSFPTATVQFGAETLAAFRRVHPGVHVELADGEPYENVARLRARVLDLALVFDVDGWPMEAYYDGQSAAPEVRLDSVHLFDDPFLLVMPRDHPLADHETVELRGLEGERIVGSPVDCSPWGPDLQRACREAGFEPSFEASYRTADFAAMQAIVASGRGVSLLPRLALGGLQEGVAVRRLERAPVRHVHVAMLADAHHSAPCRTMLELLPELTAPMREAAASAQPDVAA